MELVTQPYLKFRLLDDGRYVAILRQIYTWRLVIGRDPDFYDNAWCYDAQEAAIAAMDEWDPLVEPEPSGWIRHPFTGRRRVGGDPSTEYVNF